MADPLPPALYVVATPLGNLGDLTARAASILHEIDWIACEDTRQTSKLLGHLGLDKPMLSYHEHNEAQRAGELVEKIVQGARIALVSDAGTPLISDPGYRLVRAALEAGVTVVPIPGPSAVITALSASGLPTDAFYFGGFLPRKQGERRKLFESLRSVPGTLAFYEAPHRILESLDDVQAALGDPPVVIGRELTKLHEEFLRGKASEVRANLAARAAIKGEITLLIGPRPEVVPDTSLAESVRRYEAEGMARMDALKRAARERGLSKREAYKELDNAK